MPQSRPSAGQDAGEAGGSYEPATPAKPPTTRAGAATRAYTGRRLKRRVKEREFQSQKISFFAEGGACIGYVDLTRNTPDIRIISFGGWTADADCPWRFGRVPKAQNR
jgi:hypothetical protein